MRLFQKLNQMNESILHINNLSIGYSKPICSNIQANVKKGELVGLTGKNGSGKSTLIRSLLGLESLLSGEIFLQGENLKNWEVKKRAQKIAAVFSRLNQVPAIPVFDLVALGRLPFHSNFSKLNSNDKDWIHHAIELVGIVDLKNRFANQLSDGQLQMVMIARALAQDTELVLMDEPTSHLDIENQFKIFELIHKLSEETEKTFIVASHQIELVLQNASQIWWLDDGEFHAGLPEQIAYEQQIFEKLSQEKIRFDYAMGSFRFQHLKNKKVNLVTDGSDLAYWVKHALERNGFEISSDSEKKIRINQGQIHLNQSTFGSIKELIEYLKSKLLKE